MSMCGLSVKLIGFHGCKNSVDTSCWNLKSILLSLELVGMIILLI